MTRRMGWVELPLRCPGCTRKLPLQSAMSYGGAVRCIHCSAVLYVALAQNLNMAFVIELTAAELRTLKARALTLPQLLAHFNATFPVAPVPAP